MSGFEMFGECVGAIRQDRYVEFWFRSLDGDSSDSRQLMVEFPSEAIAHSVWAVVFTGVMARSA